MDGRILAWLLFMFSLWTFFSCTCHWCSKAYLSEVIPAQETEYYFLKQFYQTLILTAGQVCLCLTMLQFTVRNTEASVKYTFFFTHFIASFMTNFSFTYMNAAATVTIKLLEPVMTAFLTRWIVGNKNITLYTYTALFCLCFGIIAVVGNPVNNFSIGVGTLLAMISNTYYGIRNITKKHGIHTIIVEKESVLNYVALAVMICACFVYTQSMDRTLCYYLGSLISHGIYGYISMFVVLSSVDVVLHAVLNIMKRAAVIMFFLLVAMEKITMTQLLGVVICIVGLVLYTRDKNRITSKEISVSEQEDKKTDERRLKYANIMMSIFTAILLLGISLINHTPTPNHPVLSRAVDTSLSHSEKVVFNPPIVQKMQQYIPYQPYQPINFNIQKITNQWREHNNKVFANFIVQSKKAVILNIKNKRIMSEAMFDYGLYSILQKFNVFVQENCSTFGSGKKLQKEIDKETMVISYVYPTSPLKFCGGNVNMSRFLENHNKFLFIVKSLKQLNAIIENFNKLQTATANVWLLIDQRLNFNKEELISRIKSSSPAIQTDYIYDLTLSMEFNVGFMEPTYDIVHVTNHKTLTSPIASLSEAKGIRYDARDLNEWKDWRHWESKDEIESAYWKAFSALFFINSGRAVIVESLHDAYACLISDLPTLVITAYIDEKELAQFKSAVLAKEGNSEVYFLSSYEEAAGILTRVLTSTKIKPLAPFMSCIETALWKQPKQASFLLNSVVAKSILGL